MGWLSYCHRPFGPGVIIIIIVKSNLFSMGAGLHWSCHLSSVLFQPLWKRISSHGHVGEGCGGGDFWGTQSFIGALSRSCCSFDFGQWPPASTKAVFSIVWRSYKTLDLSTPVNLLGEGFQACEREVWTSLWPRVLTDLSNLFTWYYVLII